MNHDTHDARRKQVTLGETRSLDVSSAGQLMHLEDLEDVRVADGNPDIRGWEVRAADGGKVGEVAGLLVDTGAMKVRYVELKLEQAVAERVAKSEGATDPRVEPGRYKLVPIGLLRLDDEQDFVHLTPRAAQIVGLVGNEGDALVRDRGSMPRPRSALGADGGVEHEVDRDAWPTVASDELYASEQFDERTCLGRRRRADSESAYLIRQMAASKGTNTKQKEPSDARRYP